MEGNGHAQPWMINEEVLKGLSPQIRQSVIEYETYKVNMGLMAQISAQMKEIPFHQSEVPPDGDRNPLQRVEFLDEGGVLTYMDGYPLPYRGFPLAENVEKIDVIKKLAKASISGLFHSLKKRKWLVVLLLPAVFLVRDILIASTYACHRLIDRFRIKTFRLSQCMRELHRASSAINPGDLGEFRDMARDVACNVIEFDNAYRFRFQDIIEELDKKALKKNTVRELNRLFTVMQSRERTQEIRDTWTLAKLFVNFYLRFDKKLRNMVRDTLLELDVEKFKLTPEDKQFCVKRKDYVFGFMK